MRTRWIGITGVALIGEKDSTLFGGYASSVNEGSNITHSAAQIGHDNRMVPREVGRERRPHVARVTEPVQQHNGRPLAADADVKRRTRGLDILRAERGWKRLNLWRYRPCQGNGAERAVNEPEHVLSPIVGRPITMLDAHPLTIRHSTHSQGPSWYAGEQIFLEL